MLGLLIGCPKFGRGRTTRRMDSEGTQNGSDFLVNTAHYFNAARPTVAQSALEVSLDFGPKYFRLTNRLGRAPFIALLNLSRS